MRLFITLAVLCSACAANSNNGNGKVQVDVHDIRPGVWYCVPIEGRQAPYAPCYETEADCMNNRYRAVAHGLEVGDCAQQNKVFCFQTTDSEDRSVDRHCLATAEYCRGAQQRALNQGYQVTDCVSSR